jgi:hypothetical protein
LFELGVSLMPARIARAMACGEGCRLVQKEQLRVVIRSEQCPLHVVKFQFATNPGFVRPLVADLLRIIVEDSPVAHQLPPIGDCMELAIWIDAIL